MPTQKRAFPPRNIHRFNYWEFFRPGGLKTIAPLTRHIQHQFHLLLNASPAVWKKEVRPWLHKDVSAIRNRPLYALIYYVEHDKAWGSDKTAQAVLKTLPPRQQAAVQRHFRAIWPERSKRPARLVWTWEALLTEIAYDQDIFEGFCKDPPMSGDLSGTEKRIYLSYSKQAMKLLGGGTYIPKTRRHLYRDLLDGVSLLTPSGRLPSQSIFPEFDWLTLSREQRREAKTHTLHWFRHALRNMREYRHGRLPIPWPHKCDKNRPRHSKKILQVLIQRTPLILGNPYQS